MKSNSPKSTQISCKTETPHLSLLMWCLAVQTTVTVVPPHAVVLQDVQHPGHLTED